MIRLEFEELELKLQQSSLPLKSYLQQVNVSYSTYHYWRKKCSVAKTNANHELVPISFKQDNTDLSFADHVPQGVALLFSNGLRAYFGGGSEKLLMELLSKSLHDSHV